MKLSRSKTWRELKGRVVGENDVNMGLMFGIPVKQNNNFKKPVATHNCPYTVTSVNNCN